MQGFSLKKISLHDTPVRFANALGFSVATYISDLVGVTLRQRCRRAGRITDFHIHNAGT